MIRTLLFVAVLVPGVIGACRSRFGALLLYLWIAFFRPEDFVWIDVSWLHLSLLAGALLVVSALLEGTWPNVTHPLSVGALLFLLAAAIAQTAAPDQALGWGWVFYLAKVVLIALLSISLITDREKFLLALCVIAVSFGFHGAKAGVASLLAGGARFGSGVPGEFVDNNGYALAMAMIGPFLVCVAQNAKWRPLRWGAIAAVPLLVVSIVSTYSRGGFLALVAASVALILFQPRRAGWLLLAVVFALPMSIFITRQDGYMQRLATIQTYQQVHDESALSRLYFWQVAIDMARDHPFGVGLFNYEKMYDAYDISNGEYGSRRSVHSSHFQVLAETGVVGTLAWAGSFIYAFVLAFRIRRRGFAAADPQDGITFITAANALMASMFAFVVGGAFIALALNDLTWLSFGLIAALDRISRRAPMLATSRSVEMSGRATAPWAGAASLAR